MDHFAPQQHDQEKARERDIASQIFGTSAMMLGLCLTIISLVKGMPNPDRLDTIVDDVSAVDALTFLIACFLSYAVLRSRHQRRMRRLESLADAVFLLGLTGMGVACVLFVWTIL